MSAVEPRLRLVRRMAEFTGVYPWQWTPAEGEAFIAHLRCRASSWATMSLRARTDLDA